MVMGIIGWIVLGFIAGYIDSTLVNNRGQGFAVYILVGMGGAVMGGWIFNAVGATGVTSFNFWSLPIAVVGAVVFLAIWHAIQRSPAQA